ncbi:putative WRKY transcription factor 35 [Hordeum vulgare]|nr:putative WRKY transcription factor 35 [Hordeum vulgare]
MPGIVKQEHVEMAFDIDTGLMWSCDNYVCEEMELQQRTLEEIAVRRCGREEDDAIVLSDSEEGALPQPALVRSGDPGHGYSKDGGAGS